MNLTSDDLNQIRLIMCEEAKNVVSAALRPIENRLEPIENEVKALCNDVSELYDMISELSVSRKSA